MTPGPSAGRTGPAISLPWPLDACWQALRGTLEDTPEEPNWRAVKAGLRVQARLLRPLEPLADALPGEDTAGGDLLQRLDERAWPLSAQHRHRLQGTLLDQSRWLGTLVRRPAPPQAVLEAQVVRIYRKACRELHEHPYRRRARRRLRRLLALVELTGAGSGPIQKGRLATMARAGRRLHRMLVEHRRLNEPIARARSRRRARTMKQRQRDIAQAIEHEVARHFSQRPRQFADRLSWEIFCCLSEQPERRYAAVMPASRVRPHG